MKMKKKLLSLFTILCMVLALFPVSAFAESSTITFSALEGTGTGDEGYDKLIDGKKTADNDSKWCTNVESGAYIVIKASEPIIVNGYTLTTGNDNSTCQGRNPKSWGLYGSTDYDETTKSGTWTAISTVENDTTMKDVNYEPYSFQTSENNTYYQYYKLEITAVQSDSEKTMQLGEMEFSYTMCEHSWTVTGSTEADCTHPKYETKTCSGACGQTITVPVGSPLGHVDNGSGVCTACEKLFIQQVGAFTVSNAIKDEDYTYENNELKILTANPITIQNTDPNTATTDRIVVKKDVSANVTLAGVNIDVSATDKACAFKIEDDSRQNVTVTLLEGTMNILKSGSGCAGLQKNGDGDDVGTLYINGSGTLEATGGNNGAGIGGGNGEGKGSFRNIEILSGNITAQGGFASPGIGGSNNNTTKGIKISGGFVHAIGGNNGSGIGDGANGNLYDITITGGVVYAEGGESAAGIGDAYIDGYPALGTIIISGGTVTAKGGGNGADDIGKGGGKDKGPTVIITGGSVKAVTGTVTEPKNTLGGGFKVCLSFDD